MEDLQYAYAEPKFVRQKKIRTRDKRVIPLDHLAHREVDNLTFCLEVPIVFLMV